ncbi:MAG: mechanosensitive ion channel family protein [Clostridia bacterium]|nr:mechanosensitive ion channel family protein [Clostridia bacterium]
MPEVFSWAAFGALLSSLWRTVVILALCLIGVKMMLKLFDRGFEKLKIDQILRTISRNIFKFLLYFLTLLIVADSLGISVTSLIAAFSVVGLAASLAVQGSLTNVASGVVLLLTQPFSKGDFVEAGGVSGTVEDVGLIYTLLVTGDNKVIHVPNSEISATKITNYSVKANRRVDIAISASYDDATEKVKNSIRSAITSVDGILDDPAPFINISSYGDSAINYIVRVWCSGDDYWNVNFALTEAIRVAFERDGVEMTYNHLNVHILDNAADK